MVLNDLCVKLLQSSSSESSISSLNDDTNGMTNKEIWKQRLEEKLGGEGTLLSLLVPKLIPLMELPPLNQQQMDARRRLMVQFDINTSRRFERLGSTVRKYRCRILMDDASLSVPSNHYAIDLDRSFHPTRVLVIMVLVRRNIVS